MTANSAEPDVADAVRAFLAGVRLAEPVLARLWQAAGITLTQLHVLHHLSAGPEPAGRVAQALGLSSASATRIFDRLEDHGLISRRRNPTDRRCVEIHLEPRGRRLVGEKARVLKGTNLEQGVRSMTPEQRRQLAASMRLLAARVREIDAEKEMVAR
jgi:DNA-binding MarR family transcriptional regulator